MLWNGSVFGDRFRRCNVDDSRIRSKTAPFWFENGLVWTGRETVSTKTICIIDAVVCIVRPEQKIVYENMIDHRSYICKQLKQL